MAAPESCAFQGFCPGLGLPRTPTQPHPSVIRCQPLRVVQGPSHVSCQWPVVAAALSLLQCHVRMLPQWRQRYRCAPDTSNRCVLPRAGHSGVGSRPPLALASLILSSSWLGWVLVSARQKRGENKGPRDPFAGASKAPAQSQPALWLSSRGGGGKSYIKKD